MKSIIRIMCQRCNTKVYPIVSEAGPHFKATCPECGKYIKFLPKHQVEDDDAA